MKVYVPEYQARHDTTMAGMAVTATVGTDTEEIVGKAEVMAKKKREEKKKLNCLSLFYPADSINRVNDKESSIKRFDFPALEVIFSQSK